MRILLMLIAAVSMLVSLGTCALANGAAQKFEGLVWFLIFVASGAASAVLQELEHIGKALSQHARSLASRDHVTRADVSSASSDTAIAQPAERSNTFRVPPMTASEKRRNWIIGAVFVALSVVAFIVDHYVKLPR